MLLSFIEIVVKQQQGWCQGRLEKLEHHRCALIFQC